MYSPEGEKVDFVKPIDPKDKNVELWMGELEMMMKTTVRWILKLSIDDYLKKDRNDWVLEHPG